MSIRIGIMGYGNLGRGIECAMAQNPDMELVAVFTRRPPETVKILTPGVAVRHADEAPAMKDDIDVLILCGGSATDLPRQTPDFTARQKHLRECFVVAAEGADKARIEREIVTMPNYFADYDTTVHFVSAEELKRDHSGIPHGGRVIRCGKTGFQGEHTHLIEYSLKLDSNPEFTSSVLVACARAAHRMNAQGESGCKTLFDIPPAYLSAKTDEELRSTLL